MAANNGGPAFPQPLLETRDGSIVSAVAQDSPDDQGMSLRDYFAAHAPKRPQPWFKPNIPPIPEAIYDHEHSIDRCGYDTCSPTNWRERGEWQDEYDKQHWIQWPYAWADAQLRERER
jgi:hypothetical protein